MLIDEVTKAVEGLEIVTVDEGGEHSFFLTDYDARCFATDFVDKIDAHGLKLVRA